MKPETYPGRFERTLTMLVVAALAVAAGVGLGYRLAAQMPRQTGAEPGAPADPGARAQITAAGRLLPEGGVIPVYGPVGDRIAKMYPLEPGALTAGSPIADLASRKDRQLEVALAETQLAEAKAARAAVEQAGKRKVGAAEAELKWVMANRASDRTATDARLAALKLQADYAAKQLARVKEKGVVAADEDVDKAELVKAQADAELAAARIARERAEVAQEASELAAQAKVEAAGAELREALARTPTRGAEERLELARQMSEATTIRAPVAGTVLKVFGHVGQPTGLEPIVLLAAVSPMTAVVEVPEADAGVLAEWLSAGPVAAEVVNPGLVRPFRGTVRSRTDLTRLTARGFGFAPGPREAPDRLPFEVVVHIDDAGEPEASRLVGLPVTVALAPRK